MPGEFDAIHLRHANVHQDDLGHVLGRIAQLGKRRRTVFRFAHHPVRQLGFQVGQQHPQPAAGRRLVIHDEYAQRVHHPFPRR